MLGTICRRIVAARVWRLSPILAIGLLEIVLFTRFCTYWWTEERREERPATFAGEGMIVRGDGLGYYAWLRSLMIDGDLSFDNEFEEHNIFRDGLPPLSERTPLGLRVNVQSIGPACVWAPAVLTTHTVLRLWPSGSPWPTDGYSLPYQLAVGLTSLATSLLGLAFLFGICRQFASPGWAALAAAFLAGGTTIVYYEMYEVSMAHGMGTTAMAAFVWYWLKTYGSLSPRRWLAVGALLGVAALMRWQLTVFALLPTGECLLLAWRSLRSRSFADAGKAAMGLALAGLATLVVLVPQFIAWRCVFGSWHALPHTLAHRWLSPSWWQVLITRDRSLFYWTPITMLAVGGLLFYSMRRSPRPSDADVDEKVRYRRRQIALLTIAFAVEVYFVAGVYGTGVYLGAAYGFRLLTESVVVLAPGLTLLLVQSPPARMRLIGAGCFVLVVWNLLVIGQYQRGMVPSQGGAALRTMIANVPRLWNE
jgi:hypothetical protein